MPFSPRTLLPIAIASRPGSDAAGGIRPPLRRVAKPKTDRWHKATDGDVGWRRNLAISSTQHPVFYSAHHLFMGDI